MPAETMGFILYSLVSVLLLTLQLYGTEAYEVTSSASNSKSGRASSTNSKHEVHIVYMGGVSETTTTNHEHAHSAMLQRAVGSVEGASILYSYKNSFNGFAAAIPESAAESIRGMDGVVSVFKSKQHQLHTTHSWQFLGLNPTEGFWPESYFGNGTIVGMVDTGVWPESKSFSDDGFGPIPSRWKGSCVPGPNFTTSDCNKKLIGAKFYYKGYEAAYGEIIAPEIRSARDTNGHGTHTSSTAAGAQVANASYAGMANGTASGGAPLARVAMYKVCWFEGCDDADILAAFEDSISDGVDLLSFSIGGSSAVDYKSDSFAIGSFHAVAKGIVVSCAAGNSGPNHDTVVNISPWMFTVAASTTNRMFQSSVHLGDQSIVPGFEINRFEMNSTYPIVYSEGSQTDNSSSIILVTKVEGMNQGNPTYVGLVTIADAIFIPQVEAFEPQTTVNSKDGDVILKYINSTDNPTAIIYPSVSAFDTIPAPVMTDFSSVGPSTITATILKPDITAPGVDILAAFSPFQEGNRVGPDFKLLSGTSMATPHVTGAATLVKAVHLDWSPAAIKSALMTTATPLNTSIDGNSELASGAGQINPARAADPGLVFNLTTTDYINFLCSIGYTPAEVGLITGAGNQTCPTNPPGVLDLNYPSIFLTGNHTTGLVHNITRTATNVGPIASNYAVTVSAPEGIDVQVKPSTLQFSDVDLELSFSVILTAQKAITTYNFGSITWTDSTNSHSVRMVVGVGPAS